MEERREYVEKERTIHIVPRTQADVPAMCGEAGPFRVFFSTEGLETCGACREACPGSVTPDEALSVTAARINRQVNGPAPVPGRPLPSFRMPSVAPRRNDWKEQKMEQDWFDADHLARPAAPLVIMGAPSEPLVSGAFHARLSYSDAEEVSDELAPYRWEVKIHEPGRGAQMYVLTHHLKRLVVLAFRGSEAKGAELFWDWVVADARALVLRKWGKNLPPKVRYSWGFQGPVQLLWPAIQGVCAMQDHGYRVIPLGHSMGAGMAAGTTGRLRFWGTHSGHRVPFTVDRGLFYEPPKPWNRAGKEWMAKQTYDWVSDPDYRAPGQALHTSPLNIATIINTAGGHRDAVTYVPAWRGRHGGPLIVLGQKKAYQGPDAVDQWNENKPPQVHTIPGWRPISRLVKNLRGSIGAHRGEALCRHLDELYRAAS